MQWITKAIHLQRSKYVESFIDMWFVLLYSWKKEHRVTITHSCFSGTVSIQNRPITKTEMTHIALWQQLVQIFDKNMYNELHGPHIWLFKKFSNSQHVCECKFQVASHFSVWFLFIKIYLPFFTCFVDLLILSCPEIIPVSIDVCWKNWGRIWRRRGEGGTNSREPTSLLHNLE